MTNTRITNLIIFLSMTIAATGCSDGVGLKTSEAPEAPAAPEVIVLEPTVSFDVDVGVLPFEPSGLALADDGSLWTVNDKDGKLYNITAEGGTLIGTSPFVGEDLEGIAIDQDGDFWIVEEGTREVINVSAEGVELSRRVIAVDGVGSNSGLEGICIDDEGNFYVLNEKDPMLWVKLNADFTINDPQELDISGDLSGITYDSNRDLFWIVSDKSGTLMKWSPADGLIAEHVIDIDDQKAEGVAHDSDNDTLYVITDDSRKLYVYDASNL